MPSSIDELIAEVSATRAKRNLLLEQLVPDSSAPPFGLELQSRDDRYAALLPEPSEPNKARLVWFDSSGISGHTVYNDARSAVEDALRNGYTQPVPGTMDALSRHDRWKYTTASFDLTHAYLEGEISQEQLQCGLASLAGQFPEHHSL